MSRLSLAPLAPNPWRDATRVRFVIPASSAGAHAAVRVYDPAGRLVTTLADETMAAGPHDVAWSGLDGHARRVSAGVYFVRLEAGDAVLTRRTVVLR